MSHVRAPIRPSIHPIVVGILPLINTPALVNLNCTKILLHLFLSYLYRCICEVHMHICLQLPGSSPQTPNRYLPMDPDKRLLFSGTEHIHFVSISHSLDKAGEVGILQNRVPTFVNPALGKTADI